MYYRRNKLITVRKKDNGKLERIIIGRKENFQLEFYPTWGLNIKYLLQGYNDYELPLLIFQLFFGAFYITFPWRHNIKVEPGYDAPSYGIVYHVRSLQCYWNKTCKIISMPYDYVWIRTSLLLKDGTWEHETKGNSKDFYESKIWKDKRWCRVIPYKHITSNEGHIDLFVTCTIKEREWRQKWLKWTKIGRKTRKTVDVNFSEEVGKGRGSWKGGTIGTGFNIPKNGTFYDALKDMEKQYNMYSPIIDRQKKIKQILK